MKRKTVRIAAPVDRNRPSDFLGVDVGEAQIGIARGSNLARIAQPLKTVPAAGAVNELKKLVSNGAVAGVVVGLPRNLNGNDTAQTGYVRNWTLAAKTKIGLPFYWQDEALTTREAAGKIQNSKTKNQTANEHSLAAAIILQDFLDSAAEARLKA